MEAVSSHRYRALAETCLIVTYLLKRPPPSLALADGDAVGDALAARAVFSGLPVSRASSLAVALNDRSAGPRRSTLLTESELAWLYEAHKGLEYLLQVHRRGRASGKLLDVALDGVVGASSTAATTHPYNLDRIEGTVVVPDAMALTVHFSHRVVLAEGDTLYLEALPSVEADGAPANDADKPVTTHALTSTPDDNKLVISTNRLRYRLVPAGYDEQVFKTVQVRKGGKFEEGRTTGGVGGRAEEGRRKGGGKGGERAETG